MFFDKALEFAGNQHFTTERSDISDGIWALILLILPFGLLLFGSWLRFNFMKEVSDKKEPVKLPPIIKVENVDFKPKKLSKAKYKRT
ncbi:MAG: hypothetical protein K1X72_12885 [Pyrinomonadaceae bacterium]|nr:hypothetical protein [Pyrinomonadaceae bacterium]